MSLRKLTYKSLSNYLTDRQETKNGELYAHRPKITPQAYLVKINNPASSDQIDILAKHAKGPSHHVVRTLYNEFNGIDVFLQTFFIYGYQGELDREKSIDTQNIPFDSIRLQTYGKPAFSPSKSFILGEFNPIESDLRFIDTILPEGNIACGLFFESPEITDQFKSIEEWLVVRLKLAQHDYESFGISP